MSELAEEDFMIMTTHKRTEGHYYFLKLPTTGRNLKIINYALAFSLVTFPKSRKVDLVNIVVIGPGNLWVTPS